MFRETPKITYIFFQIFKVDIAQIIDQTLMKIEWHICLRTRISATHHNFQSSQLDFLDMWMQVSGKLPNRSNSNLPCNVYDGSIRFLINLKSQKNFGQKN